MIKANRPIVIINDKPYRNITEIETYHHPWGSRTVVYRNDEYLMTLYYAQKKYGETKNGRPVLCFDGQELLSPSPPSPSR